MVCTGFCHFIYGHPSIEAIELQIDIEGRVYSSQTVGWHWCVELPGNTDKA